MNRKGLGYVLGFAEGLAAGRNNFSGKICVPSLATPPDLVALFVEWVAQNSEKRREYLPVIFHTALERAFPCSSATR